MSKTTTTETAVRLGQGYSRAPWHVAPQDPTSYDLLIQDEGGYPFASVHDSIFEGRQEANAHLIAAAPELYEFAKRIDEIIRQGRPSDHLWNYCVEHREGVIARAEGGAS